MWNNTISLYIFFKEIGKIRLEKSHKGKKQTLCENPILNAIQSLSTWKKVILSLKFLQICSYLCVFPFNVVNSFQKTKIWSF